MRRFPPSLSLSLFLSLLSPFLGGGSGGGVCLFQKLICERGDKKMTPLFSFLFFFFEFHENYLL